MTDLDLLSKIRNKYSTLDNMSKNPHANYQDLLKTIAIIAMIIDHLGLYIFQDTLDLRVIGRIVMPIFCFFVGYNFTAPKALIMLLGLTLTLLNYVLWHMTVLNMLIGIYFGQCILYVLHKYYLEQDKYLWSATLFMLLIAQFSQPFFEYGTLGTAFIIVGRLYRLGKEDPGFMLLLVPSTMILCTQFNFNIQSNIIATILVGITCYVLSTRYYDRPIPVNLKCISRRSLVIYFCHVVVISTLGYYLSTIA